MRVPQADAGRLSEPSFPCPCCGHPVFGESPGSYEICPVCFWEDDMVQLRRPGYSGAGGEPAPLLRDLHPGFSAELIALLEAEGCADLALRAYDLRIIARCPCGDDFCQSFYTAPKPEGAYGPGHSNVSLSSNSDHGGMIVLDVVNGHIMFVEVLYYPPLPREQADNAGPGQ